MPLFWDFLTSFPNNSIAVYSFRWYYLLSNLFPYEERTFIHYAFFSFKDTKVTCTPHDIFKIKKCANLITYMIPYEITDKAQIYSHEKLQCGDIKASFIVRSNEMQVSLYVLSSDCLLM